MTVIKTRDSNSLQDFNNNNIVYIRKKLRISLRNIRQFRAILRKLFIHSRTIYFLSFISKYELYSPTKIYLCLKIQGTRIKILLSLYRFVFCIPYQIIWQIEYFSNKSKKKIVLPYLKFIRGQSTIHACTFFTG